MSKLLAHRNTHFARAHLETNK